MQCFLLVLLVLGAAVALLARRRLTRFSRGNEAPNEAIASGNGPSREPQRSGRPVDNSKRKLLVRLSASTDSSKDDVSTAVRVLVELAQWRLAHRGSGGDGGAARGPPAGGVGQPMVQASWLQPDGRRAAKVVVPGWMAEQLASANVQGCLDVRIRDWAPPPRRVRAQRAAAVAGRAAAQQRQVGAKMVAAAAAAAAQEVRHQLGPLPPHFGPPPWGHPPPPMGWPGGMPMPAPWHGQWPAERLRQHGIMQHAGGMAALAGMGGAAAAAAATAEARPSALPEQIGSPCTPAAPPGGPAPIDSAAAAAAAFLADLGPPSSPVVPLAPSQADPLPGTVAPNHGGTPQPGPTTSGTAGSAAASPAAEDGHEPAFPPHKGDLSLIRSVQPGSHRTHRGTVYVRVRWHDSYVAESQLVEGTLQEYWQQQGGRPADLPPLPGKKAAAKKPGQRGKRATAAPAAWAAVAATPAAAAKAAARVAFGTPAGGRQRTRLATQLAAAAQAGSNQQ